MDKQEYEARLAELRQEMEDKGGHSGIAECIQNDIDALEREYQDDRDRRDTQV